MAPSGIGWPDALFIEIDRKRMEVDALAWIL